MKKSLLLALSPYILPIISKHQYAYTPLKSSELLLQILVDEIQIAIEKQEYAGLILLDAETAFERIPHNALAVALLNTGAPIKLITATMNFIKNRSSR